GGHPARPLRRRRRIGEDAGGAGRDRRNPPDLGRPHAFRRKRGADRDRGAGGFPAGVAGLRAGGLRSPARNGRVFLELPAPGGSVSVAFLAVVVSVAVTVIAVAAVGLVERLGLLPLMALAGDH